MREAETISAQEKIHQHNGTDVIYKFRPGTEDRQHLTVIFSGFRAEGTYDFDGAIVNGLRSNVLWVQDSFSGDFAYYLCRSMDFSIEAAVHSLVEKIRLELGLERTHCSLAGFSKGGTAALYFGIKYNYGAILSTVPQFHIGSYVERNWPKVFASMSEASSREDKVLLDTLLPDIIRNDVNFKRNIYLFSSEADPQYATEISPYLGEFTKYKNFNFILTDSPLVTSHNAVTRYNVPLIMSVLSSLADGVAPRLGQVRNGVNNFKSEEVQQGIEVVRASASIAQEITSVRVQNGRLFLEGYAFLQGYEASRYGDVRSFLKLQSKEHQYTYLLGGVVDPHLSSKFFKNVFCNYSVGKFSTLAHRGIDLETIEEGIYDARIVTIHAGITTEFTPRISNPASLWGETSNSIVNFEMTETAARLVKRPGTDSASASAYFELQKAWCQDDLIHLEGYFAIPGFQARNYGDAAYYLAFTRSGQPKPHRIVRIASAHRDDVSDRLADPWLDYSKAYFATRAFKGVSLADLTPGTYELSITVRFGGAIFTQATGLQLAAKANYPGCITASDRPLVGVIGSCVSRDNFNSRLSPGWKDRFAFHGAQYQMSLVSLMSPRVPVPELGDLDEHARSHTLRDFEKTYLEELMHEPPGVLIVDLFADARFGCLVLDSGIVTNNEWKLHESAFYKSLVSSKLLSMASDEEQYLIRFRKSVQELREFCREFLPNTLIVLNSARAIDTYIKNDQRISLGAKAAQELNARWEKLDAVFAEEMNCPQIRVNTQGLMSDASHPWGPGPVHYENVFYRDFQAQLLAILDGRIGLTLDPAA